MVLIDKIFKVLKKKRYNREEPFIETDLKNRLEYFVKLNKPIKLVGFWGIGSKNTSNWADNASCKFLEELNKEIKHIYPPGIEFTFIFATKHGEHNGFDRQSIESYCKDIEKLFRKYDFKFLYLDSLWEKYELSFEKINRTYNNKEKDWWQQVENHETIERNAKNRNKKLNYLEGAQKYYIFRNLEKEMLEKEFKNAIFHAFSDSKLRCVLPNMPTLYFYSRKGWSNTPWFVT